jgi:hypothetical protein
MKYAVEMASGGMIPNSIKIGTGVQILLGGSTHKEQDDLISLLLFISLSK